MEHQQDSTSAAGGQSRSNAGLGVGSLIAIQWGSGCCTARVKAETEERYFVKMDWGGKEVMDMAELRKRKFVLIPERLSFWRRWLTPNVGRNRPDAPFAAGPVDGSVRPLDTETGNE